MGKKLFYLGSYLGLHTDEKYKDGIIEGLFHYAQRTYRLVYIAILLCESFMMAALCLSEGGPFVIPRQRAYLCMYGILIFSTVLFLLIDGLWRVKKWKNDKVYLNMGFGAAFFVAVWSCGITLLDQSGGNGLTVYAYMLIMLAVLTVLKPWQSFLLYGTTFAMLNLLQPYFLPVDGESQIFNNLMNSLFITVIAISASILFNADRIKSCRDKIIIDEQYRELSIINERLKGEVIVDSLTGLYNRRYLDDVIERKIQEEAFQKENCPVACLMLDVDYFKQYNDMYGHQKGDECLVKLSDMIKKCFPLESARTVRYGGEEFLIFIFGCTKEQALAAAENLCRMVEKSRIVRKDMDTQCLTVSIGVNIGIAGGKMGMKEYIHGADEALYQAKRDGRNCVRIQK